MSDGQHDQNAPQVSIDDLMPFEKEADGHYAGHYGVHQDIDLKRLKNFEKNPVLASIGLR